MIDRLQMRSIMKTKTDQSKWRDEERTSRDLSKGRVESRATTDETNGTSGLLDILRTVEILSGSAPFTDGKEQEENHESAENRANSPRCSLASRPQTS